MCIYYKYGKEFIREFLIALRSSKERKYLTKMECGNLIWDLVKK